jgi:hypothetical protein
MNRVTTYYDAGDESHIPESAGNGSAVPPPSGKASSTSSGSGGFSAPPPTPNGVTPLISLMDIAPGPPDARKTVLGNRFLCVGGSMLFIGPSGIGKSSASVQQDILWSLGRPAFGIRPGRPLQILTIQAENDAEDLAEMRDGVCRGLQLTDEDREAVRQRVFYHTECELTGGRFLASIDALLQGRQFDLLRIDPFLAYLGADEKDTPKTAAFLRNGLNPLLAKHGVACILNHHTPKATNRNTSDWRPYDWMYSGAGGADITNWARAAVVVDSTHAGHVFKFVAAKRGARIGWVDDRGQKEIVRYFCHASDGLYWREATAEDLEAVEKAASEKKSKKAAKTAEDMLALIPADGTIPKVELLERARDRGFTREGADDMLRGLLERSEVFMRKVKRSGTNPQVQISRHGQEPVEEDK